MSYLRWRRLLELAALDRPALAPLILRKGRPASPPVRDLTETWDAVYKGGAYERLSRSDQRHHHRLLAALVCEARPDPSVLEIGCGEGVFLTSLAAHPYRSYLGVDVSQVAIDGARRLHGGAEGASFEVGDGAAFVPPGAYDAIVFPECLEYLGEPSAVLAHYRNFLAPGGVIGVSMWLSANAVRLWTRVQALARVRDQAVVLSEWGGGWVVAVLD